MYLPIFFRVASQALGQSYDCPSACEATMKDTHNTDQHQTNHNKTQEVTLPVKPTKTTTNHNKTRDVTLPVKPTNTTTQQITTQH